MHQKRTSLPAPGPWSMASLVLSLMVFVPLVTSVAGLIAGVVALDHGRSDRDMGRAVAGIILGILGTFIWTWLLMLYVIMWRVMGGLVYVG